MKAEASQPGRRGDDLETIVAGIGFLSLSEAIDKTTASGRPLFHVMGAMAEFERSLISECTRAGMAAAKACGRHLGRERKLTDEDTPAASTKSRSVTFHNLSPLPAVSDRYSLPACRSICKARPKDCPAAAIAIKRSGQGD